MRRILILIVAALALFPQVALAEEAGAPKEPPSVGAGSAILLDGKSGQVLWQQNAEEKRAIASTTKILTAILVIEHSRMSDTVVASKQATDAGGAEIYLSPGEQRSVEELLYAMMLKSGNDAAAALAEHIAGSEEKFVGLMNRKARALGAKSSHFSNPHGLQNSGHYSTAKDMAIIAQYAMRNPAFRRLVSTRKKVLPWPGNYERVLENHNGLLEKYEYATGIKTGYTRLSGQCLVSSAKKGDRELIAVVLGSRNAKQLYDDSIELLEYGFSAFTYRNLLDEGKAVGKLRKDGSVYQLVAGGDLKLLMSNQEKAQIVVVPSGALRTPIAKNKRVGSVLAVQGDRAVAKVPLLAGESEYDPTATGQGAGTLGRLGNWVRDLLPF